MPCARPPRIPPRSRHENPADLAGSPGGGRCLADRSQFYPDINLVGCVGLHALGLDRLVKLVSRNCHRRDTPATPPSASCRSTASAWHRRRWSGWPARPRAPVGLGGAAALAQITRLIDQQACTRAADDISLASALIFLALIFLALIGLVWLRRRPAPIKPGAAPVDASAAH